MLGRLQMHHLLEDFFLGFSEEDNNNNNDNNNNDNNNNNNQHFYTCMAYKKLYNSQSISVNKSEKRKER